jgi:hypothetical protein
MNINKGFVVYLEDTRVKIISVKRVIIKGMERRKPKLSKLKE